MKTVGEILKTARRRKGLKRLQIARQTKISGKYIKALEANAFTKLPEAAFVKGFIRNYCQAVGLDPDQALAVFRRDYDQDIRGQVIPRDLAATPMKRSWLWTPRTTVIGIASLVTILLLTYFTYQYRLLTDAPPLEVVSPKEEERVNSTLTVSGKTDPQGTLTINNQQVLVNDDGTFSQPLVLPSGTRTITVQATNRSGKSRTVQRTVHVIP